MKEEFLASMHTILILFAWASPFWLDWKIVFVCLGLYWLQVALFKSCVLTNMQFNKHPAKRSDMTMYAYWGEKMGYKVNREKLKFSSSYIMPIVILLITILWQIILKMPIIIKR